jgi:hypothetical protein
MKRFLAILLACAHLVQAGETSAHWRDLGPLIMGKDVVLTLAHGKRIKGSTESIEAESLVIETSKKERQSIRRSDVRYIQVSRKAGYRWRVIGTALGAGLGAAIAIPVLAETHNEGSANYDGAAAGLIVGLAVVGLLTGWHADHARDVVRLLPD